MPDATCAAPCSRYDGKRSRDDQLLPQHRRPNRSPHQHRPRRPSRAAPWSGRYRLPRSLRRSPSRREPRFPEPHLDLPQDPRQLHPRGPSSVRSRLRVPLPRRLVHRVQQPGPESQSREGPLPHPLGGLVPLLRRPRLRRLGLPRRPAFLRSQRLRPRPRSPPPR